MFLHKNLKPGHAMKKIFTLSMGMVILITVLYAGPHASASKDKTTSAAAINMVPPDENSKRVIIYIRYVEKDNKKCLAMYDSNGRLAIDTLTTYVEAGNTVIWKLEKASEIKQIDKIYTKVTNPEIFKNDAVKRFLSKSYKIDIPGNATRDIREEYFIDFTTNDNDPVTVSTDPYLRIKP